MTRLAGERLVGSQQWESGHRDVVELRVDPVGSAVTALALRPIATPMHVVVDVTGVAVGCYAVKNLILMAIGASHRAMSTGKRKRGHIVIEARVLPGGFVVAIVASAVHLTLMDVIVCMTVHTRAGRGRPLGAGIVTVGAE